MMDDRFKQQLREMALIQRRLGHEECRIAAMRMFARAGMKDAARLVGRMEVDSLLSAEEIAERERMP